MIGFCFLGHHHPDRRSGDLVPYEAAKRPLEPVADHGATSLLGVVLGSLLSHLMDFRLSTMSSQPSFFSLASPSWFSPGASPFPSGLLAFR